MACSDPLLRAHLSNPTQTCISISQGSSSNNSNKRVDLTTLTSSSLSLMSSREAPLIKRRLMSNHVMVNVARAERGLGPLQRCKFLDDLARFHAQEMAEQERVFHSVASVHQLRERLKSDHVGENAERGTSVVAIHRKMVSCNAPFLNPSLPMAKRINQFGMGTAKGVDGQLYLVQLFREGPEEYY